MKLLIRISFCGANYLGTQKQAKGKTIQGTFEYLLSKIYNQDIKITISSRLDKDVNAFDFGLSFERPHDKISLEHLKYYLERGTDNDIHIKSVVSVPDSFNPRYDCEYKQYLYLIQNRDNDNPLLNSLCYLPSKTLDEEKLKTALYLFKGTHDFRCFSTPEGNENTIIDIADVSIENKDNILYIRFKGKAFLRYQIRFMVGAAISYTLGKLSLDNIQSMLNGNYMKYIKFKVPGYGLILEKIYFTILDDKEQKTHYPSIIF